MSDPQSKTPPFVSLPRDIGCFRRKTDREIEEDTEAEKIPDPWDEGAQERLRKRLEAKFGLSLVSLSPPR